MAMIKGTGLVLSFLHISMAIGAIIRTVATLSTNAEIIPAKSESATAAACTVPTLSIMRSAMSAGILLSMNSCTSPMVPAIISRTLKSMDGMIWLSGSIPDMMNKSAEPSAINGLYLLNISINT